MNTSLIVGLTIGIVLVVFVVLYTATKAVVPGRKTPEVKQSKGPDPLNTLIINTELSIPIQRHLQAHFGDNCTIATVMRFQLASDKKNPLLLIKGIAKSRAAETQLELDRFAELYKDWVNFKL